MMTESRHRFSPMALSLWVLCGMTIFAAEPALLTAKVTAIQQSKDSIVGLRADFARLLQTAGISQAFRPESVAILDADGQSLPVRVSPELDIYRVSWAVPGATRKEDYGRVAEYTLLFGTAPGKTPAPQLQDEENLLFNGNFRQLNREGQPLGLAAAQFQKDLQVVEGLDGNKAVALLSNAEKKCSYRSQWVYCPAGSRVEYRIKYKISGAVAHHYQTVIYSYVNYRDKDGKFLSRQGALSNRSSDSDGWQEYLLTLPLPAGAASTNFELNSGSSVPGSVIIGEVKINSTAIPEITTAATAGGEIMSLIARGSNIYRYDLGTATSPVMDGFTALHPEVKYSAEHKCGFIRVARNFTRDKGSPDDLARDYVAAFQATLRLDIPNGKYQLWALSGDSQTSSTVATFYFNKSLSLNGNVVYQDDTKPAEFFRHQYLRNARHFWLPGMDYYETFVAPRFQEHNFTVEISNGRLVIDWRNLPLNAFILYPQEQAAEVARELEHLQGRRRRDAVITILPGPEEESIPPIPAETAQGFMLFRRSANEKIYPSSRPQENERLEQLSSFTPPGEMATVNFSLYPLRDLGEISIQASELSASGATIPAAAAEVRVVRYLQCKRGVGMLQVAPFLLDKRERVPVSKDCSWSWVVQFSVPQGTAPGTYRGQIKVLAAASQQTLAAIPVEISVLPFQLAPLPILQGYYYFPSEPWYSTFWGANLVGPRYNRDPEVLKLIEENERREMRFMKSLGLNSISFGDDMRSDLEIVEGEIKFSEHNRFLWWMDIYASEGLKEMPFYGFQSIGCGSGIAWLDKNNPALKEQFSPAWSKAYQSLVREGMRIQKERNWPEILWYTTDERSNHRETGAQEGLKLAQLVREIPGATSIASMNGPWEHIMVPALDISMPNIAFPITEETIKLIHQHNSKLWLYNCGSERLTLGLYPWRVKAGGRYQWHYRSGSGEQWDDGVLGGCTKYAISFNGPDGVVPALAAQTVREAIYDHRYVVTLEQAIQAAEKKLAGSQQGKLADAVRKGKDYIAFLQQRVPVDAREVIGFRIDPRAADAAVGGEFRNTDNLDRVRWAMAQLIQELQGE
ncbi:MAG: hypothetical protein GX564_04135 [Oligosphaeraceae bacterium]|nr:hypothetical protein [Oligosphaeraceae bacterium]